MFGKTNLQTDSASFGSSKAFAGIQELAKQRAALRRDRVLNTVYAFAAFGVVYAFASAMIGA